MKYLRAFLAAPRVGLEKPKTLFPPTGKTGETSPKGGFAGFAGTPKQGYPVSRPASWESVRALRWGPAIGDTEDGLVVDTHGAARGRARRGGSERPPCASGARGDLGRGLGDASEYVSMGPQAMIAGDGWHLAGVPHRGWTCTGVVDLEALEGVCDMCGRQIRYVHTMAHDNHEDVGVGVVCAAAMEGDYAAPRERERRLRLRAARRARWLRRRWRVSQAGNYRLTVGGVVAGVFRDPHPPGLWKCRLGGTFSREYYPTADAAKLALFDWVEEQEGRR